jgi:hypothetical protein
MAQDEGIGSSASAKEPLSAIIKRRHHVAGSSPSPQGGGLHHRYWRAA